MFKTNFRRAFGLFLTLIVAGSLAVGCYDDSELRNSIENLKSQLSQLQTLVNTLQNDDAVTGVTPNSDGSYTIRFKKSGKVTITNGKNGENGKDGEDGKDGKDGSIVNVVKGEDTYSFIFADGTTVVLPRYSEIRTLTFEDADYRGDEDLVAYWSSKIDDPQYGGTLLYGDGCAWTDSQNTFLSGSVKPYDPATWSGGLSGGGIALSNYGSGAFKDADYLRQLEVFNGETLSETGRTACGHEGSDNFAIVYDAGAWGSPAALAMADGVARVIESAWINNTCYTLNVLVNGNDYAAKMAENGFYKVIATGYVGDEAVGTSEYFLAKNISFVTEWVKWDLSGLGAVEKVVFSVQGSPEQYGDYGFNTPAYFALDDIAVKVYPD